MCIIVDGSGRRRTVVAVSRSLSEGGTTLSLPAAVRRSLVRRRTCLLVYRYVSTHVTPQPHGVAESRANPELSGGSIFIDPAKPGPPDNRPDPSRPTFRCTYGPMTQTNPYSPPAEGTKGTVAGTRRLRRARLGFVHQRPAARRRRPRTKLKRRQPAVLYGFDGDGG